MRVILEQPAEGVPAWLVERTRRAVRHCGWTLVERSEFTPGEDAVLLVKAGAWWPAPPDSAVLRDCPVPVFGVKQDTEWRRSLSRCGGAMGQLRWWQGRPGKRPEVWYLPAQSQRERGFQLCSRWLWQRAKHWRELYHLPALDPAWDDRPRMVQAVTSLQIGGAEQVALDLHQELNAQGQTCLLAVLGRGTRQTYAMPGWAVDLSGVEDRIEALHIAAVSFGSDLLHLHLVTGEAVEACRERGWPVMLTLHNTQEGWAPGMAVLQPNHAGSRSELLVLGCSSAVTAQFAEENPAVPSRCVWNGILPRRRDPAAAAAWRARLGMPPQGLLVLALANARAQKRLELMPPIIEALRARGVPAVLAMAGAGTEALGGLGLVAEAGSLLEAADVLLSTSAHEGLSLSQLESLAAGTPVVASRVGGAGEVEGIFTVDADAGPEAYADAIHRAVAVKDHRLPGSFHRNAMARRVGWLGRSLLHLGSSGEGLLLLTNNFSMGGAQSSARRLLLAMKACGLRVMAAVVEEDERRPTAGLQALRAAGVEVLVLRRSGVAEPEDACEELMKALAGRPPECVVFWNLIASYKVLLADALVDTGTRVVDVSPGEMFYDSMERYFHSPRTGLPYRSGLDYGQLLDAVVVKHAAEGQRARDFLGCSVAVVRNGVALPPEQSGRWRGDQGRKRGRVIIGTATRLAAHKRVEDLLDAFAILHASHPRVELRVAGGVDGHQDGYVRALKRRAHGLPVRWLGPVSDVSGFHRGCDFFAMISEPAGCPNASLEAMAAGLAVVATDVGGAGEQVITGKTGLLVPPRDVAAMAAALAELVTDGERREALGRAARQHVSQQFSMEQMVASYLQVFGLTARIS